VALDPKEKWKLFKFISGQNATAQSTRSECVLPDRFCPEICVGGMSSAVQFLMMCMVSAVDNGPNAMNWCVAGSRMREGASKSYLFVDWAGILEVGMETFCVGMSKDSRSSSCHPRFLD
jgi:hypothetical protein